MTAASIDELAPALVRLALRANDDRPPLELDYALGVVDDLTPAEKTRLIRVQATLTAALIRRVEDDDAREHVVSMYERGLT